MSGWGQAASIAARPASSVMSQATVVTSAPVAALISAAVASRVSGVLAQIVTFTPSRAKEKAEALPKPLLAAQTMADLPVNPRSIFFIPAGVLPGPGYLLASAAVRISESV